MEPNFELPDDISPTGPWRSAPPMTDDPALPALEILRDTGIADAFPELRLGDIPPDLRLCNYVPGSRATFEIRAGDRRFAVKMYVDDPSSEVQLYRKLARLGLSKDFGARAPRLLAWGPRGDARGPVALACDEAPGQVGSSPRANPRALSGGPRRWRPERGRFESRRRRQSGGQSPRPDKDPGAIAELGPRHAVCSSHLRPRRRSWGH